MDSLLAGDYPLPIVIMLCVLVGTSTHWATTMVLAKYLPPVPPGRWRRFSAAQEREMFWQYLVALTAIGAVVALLLAGPLIGWFGMRVLEGAVKLLA